MLPFTLQRRPIIDPQAALPVLLLALGAVACNDGVTDTDTTVDSDVTMTVSGTITDHPGEAPLAGAVVTGSAAGSWLFSAATDSTGAYEATFEVDDAPSELTVTATADKFMAADTTVTLTATMDLDVQLSWDSPFAKDCLAIDPDNISVEQFESTFRVLSGTSILLVFPELSEAQAARDLIEHYGFNDVCFVGRPDADMVYWLTDGGPVFADSGSPVDEDCVVVDADNLTISDSGTNYVVSDGISNLMAFPELSEALDAVELIEFYELSNICYVGRPDAEMMYWLR